MKPNRLVRQSVHFIGIGGIGMSALARYFLAEGWRVSGSDAVRSALTDELKKEGVRLVIGHRAGHGKGSALVVYSAAVRPANPELRAAIRAKATVRSYAEAIGELSRQYYTIAVSGSHGKSTTTALLGLVLAKAGFDPMVIVGTKLSEFGPPAGGSNFRKGKTYLVLEADEWNRSFYHYRPKIAVLTNIDNEHLDTYKTYRGVVAGFKEYVKNVPRNGFIVANWKDRGIRRAVAGAEATVVFYNRHAFPRHPLGIPGRHNQLNAEAAWQAAKLLGVRKTLADAVFKRYAGAWRRLEPLVPAARRLRGWRAAVYADYAHHPTEIKATLAALRERHPHERLICVFEPHQQDRLTRLFREFTHAFSRADRVVLLPAYRVAGRERGKGKTSLELAKALPERHASYARDFSAALQTIHRDATDEPCVVVFMGAGSIDADVRCFFDSVRFST